MGEFSTYEPAHFIPYSREAYDATVAAYVADAGFLAWVWLVAAVLVAVRPDHKTSAVVVAGAWVWLAVGWFAGKFAELVWIAPQIAWVVGVFGIASTFRLGSPRSAVTSRVLGGLGVTWSLFHLSSGTLEVVGLVLAPTLLATGAVLTARNARWWHWTIPMATAALLSASGLVIGRTIDVAPLACLIVGLVATKMTERRSDNVRAHTGD